MFGVLVAVDWFYLVFGIIVCFMYVLRVRKCYLLRWLPVELCALVGLMLLLDCVVWVWWLVNSIVVFLFFLVVVVAFGMMFGVSCGFACWALLFGVC